MEDTAKAKPKAAKKPAKAKEPKEPKEPKVTKPRAKKAKKQADDDESDMSEIDAERPPPAKRVARLTKKDEAAVDAARAAGVEEASLERNHTIASLLEAIVAARKANDPDANKFGLIALTKAAGTIREASFPILNGAHAKTLNGVGAGTAKFVDEYIQTGQIAELASAMVDNPRVAAVAKLAAVPGLTSAVAESLFNEFGIDDVPALKRFAAQHPDALRPDILAFVRHSDEAGRPVPRAKVQELEALFQAALEEAAGGLPEEFGEPILTFTGSYRRGERDISEGTLHVIITAPGYTTRNPAHADRTPEPATKFPVLEALARQLQRRGVLRRSEIVGMTRDSFTAFVKAPEPGDPKPEVGGPPLLPHKSAGGAAEEVEHLRDEAPPSAAVGGGAGGRRAALPGPKVDSAFAGLDLPEEEDLESAERARIQATSGQLVRGRPTSGGAAPAPKAARVDDTSATGNVPLEAPHVNPYVRVEVQLAPANCYGWYVFTTTGSVPYINAIKGRFMTGPSAPYKWSKSSPIPMLDPEDDAATGAVARKKKAALAFDDDGDDDEEMVAKKAKKAAKLVPSREGIALPTEEDVFELFRIPFVAPKDRDVKG